MTEILDTYIWRRFVYGAYNDSIWKISYKKGKKI